MTSEFQWSKKFRKNSKNGGESARYDTQHSIQYSVKSNLSYMSFFLLVNEIKKVTTQSLNKIIRD